MQYVVVFITSPNTKEAEKISTILLDKHIVACINIIENVHSHFWWQGKKELAEECLLIGKTTRSNVQSLIKTTKAIHSYDVPEIIAIPIVDGYKGYLDWIEKEVK